MSASRTRNVGAYAARGNALMFLDADDVLAPDALAALAAALARQSSGVAICPWYRLELVGGQWLERPAMAAGLPVVATRVGGVPEIIVPGTGVLVPPEDPAALAEAVADMLVDDERTAEVGANGRVRSHAFSAAETDAAYELVLAEAASHVPAAAARGRA